jgi:hypothetical protein
MKYGPGRGAPHALGGSLCFTMCRVHSGVSEDTNRGTAPITSLVSQGLGRMRRGSLGSNILGGEN